MKKLIHSFLSVFGLEVRRKINPVVHPAPAVKPSVDSMANGLLRARDSFAIMPRTVIDLGAAAGTWTIKAAKVWTQSRFIMFEPLSERRNELTALHQNDNRLIPVFEAVGAENGEVNFAVSDDLDGSGISQTSAGRKVPLTTLDSAMEKQKCEGPYVIKFDTHGFELPILVGAQRTLKETELIIMECYGFRIAEKSLMLHEMCAHMEKNGFRLADIVDIMRRPDDKAFWQCDVFFLRATHPVFSRNSYSPSK